MRAKTPTVTAAHIRAVQKLQASIDGAARLSVTADWASVWREPRAEELDPLRHLGRPGLWKALTNAHLPRCVFEVPLFVVDEIGAAGDPDGDARFIGLERLIEAAQATDRGEVPSGWAPPDEDELSAPIPPEMLTVQCAEVACHGKVICTEERLAIEFPIVAGIPSTLAPARRKKLIAVLGEANNNWRLVRVGLRDGAIENTLDAIAELDLTAMPAASIEPLIRCGIDALHHVVRWAGASVWALVESPACELLDGG